MRQRLAPRQRDYHDQWFGGSGTRWAKEFLFGVENNYDLGLAAKVNMVLHGDGSMNTWIASGLAPFARYLLNGRTNILGQAQPADPGSNTYAGPRNEQFDLILTNPPFSLTQPEDEKKQAKETFVALPVSVSEALFVERWYQLLRPGGDLCVVVPESLLDTSTSTQIRLFLLIHFDIRAVVSLPYDAFRPFTSTKTAIVLARKRSPASIRAWHATYEQVREQDPKVAPHILIERTLDRLDRLDDEIFMAEPHEVGYKRRKNLADLPRPNDLISELDRSRDSVLGHWEHGSPNDPRYGFRTTLRGVASRSGLRLDPKYRWLWDFQDGHVFGDKSKARPLRDLLAVVPLTKVTKGPLEHELVVVDLDQVESRQAFLRDDIPTTDEIGSDKVSFEGAELMFAKLEPYLGKLIIDPPDGGHGNLPVGGHRFSPLAVVGSPRPWPSVLPAILS